MFKDKNLYTEILKNKAKIYFFDLKESKIGKKYLVINENRFINGKYYRNRIIIFEEDIKKIKIVLEKIINFIEDNEIIIY